ncbi:MAG: hypothetical protein AMJ81_02835 [Phycisphaerae bacterium SM23_33]|jgi:hypothetical protein|nr:MAG: hypothetical protein AMJ81_02835 [Phycisphaerae bacterium SM23_33]
MRYQVAILAACAALAMAVGAHSDPPPKPSAVPVSWELEFEYQDICSITLVLPGQKQPKTFWYVLYTITNRTGADQVFVPDFVLYTDTGQVLRSGQGVPTGVFEAVEKRHNNPLLMDLGRITGRILQGEDNAKDGVAMWPNFDPAARKFDVFIGGLSGERAKVKLPSPIEVTEEDENGKPKKVTKTEITLLKTLRLSYAIPGEAAARPRTVPAPLKKEWVMR